MVSTRLPTACQNAASRATASPFVPAGGVRMHQRPSNNAAKPAAGPDRSVPAMGWPGTKWTPSGTCGAMAAITDALVEPTSVRIAPGSRADAISRATVPDAPTGTDTITRSAPSAAFAALVV